MLEVTIIAKIQTVSIENIFYDGDIVRWRMSMRKNCVVIVSLPVMNKVLYYAKYSQIVLYNVVSVASL
jgi:hypothetical protein